MTPPASCARTETTAAALWQGWLDAAISTGWGRAAPPPLKSGRAGTKLPLRAVIARGRSQLQPCVAAPTVEVSPGGTA